MILQPMVIGYKKIVLDSCPKFLYNILYYLRKISMSDRFYTQMRQATGWCPGLPESYKFKQRRRKVAWTDEAKAQAVEMYTAEEPTPENSMEIVKRLLTN